MAGAKGYLAIISALVFCPCHLPILAAIFAGTALGATITDNYGLFFPMMALYFVGALFLGIRWMTRAEAPAGGPAQHSAASGPKVGETRQDCCSLWLEPDAELGAGRGPAEVRDGDRHR